MAKHAPAELSTANYFLMGEPLFGAEMEAHITQKQPSELGLLTITGAATGTFVADTIGAAQISAVPQSLVAVVDEAILDAGASDIVLTVSGTDNLAASITGTATIKVPAYAQNQVRTFARGFAVDVIVSADKKFKTITGVTVACAAEATNARIKLFGLPEVTDFERVGCTGEGEFQPRVRADAPVRCGSDPSAFVKVGDLREGNLRITAKYFNYMAGLARYAGQRCVVLLKEMRSGQKIPTTYHYCTQFVPSGAISTPEGSEPCMNTTEGRYQVNMTLMATTAAIVVLFGLASTFGLIQTSLGYLQA